MFGFIRLPNVGFGSSLTDKIILSNCRPNLIGTLGKIAGNVCVCAVVAYRSRVLSTWANVIK